MQIRTPHKMRAKKNEECIHDLTLSGQDCEELRCASNTVKIFDMLQFHTWLLSPQSSIRMTQH